MRVLFAELLLLYASAVAVFAQVPGQISGVVFDPLGAPFADAAVQATNAATGKVYQTASGAKGEYMLAGLPPGAYEFTVVVHGERLFVQPDVKIEAGKTVRIDARLKDTNLGALGDDALAAARLDRRPVPTGPAPRTLDGKPDLTGMWAPTRSVDAGNPEMLPWAEALVKQRIATNMKDIPTARCLPWGPTLDVPTVFKFIQSPAEIVILTEDVFSYRQIFLDGRGHPKDIDPTWMGHSIGRWEGDTLVVDTIGFNDKSWTPPPRPHTEKLHIIERVRRPDAGHLEIETTIDDPGTYMRPWTFKRATNLLVGEEIGEYICAENNQDLQHLVDK
jgi:hypothetical protein